MEMVTEYLYVRYTKQDALPFPDYLWPQNRHKNDFWITQEGECIHPHEMGDRHLLNTVRMIHRSHFSIENLYKESDADKHIKYGKAPWISSDLYSDTTEQLSKHKYFQLWDNRRIYMLLRREIKLRGLEGEI